MKTKFYVAINKDEEGFICEAINKSQMKSANMNMKLEWKKEESYEYAVNYLKSFNIEIKREINVIDFKY